MIVSMSIERVSIISILVRNITIFKIGNFDMFNFLTLSASYMWTDLLICYLLIFIYSMLLNVYQLSMYESLNFLENSDT